MAHIELYNYIMSLPESPEARATIKLISYQKNNIFVANLLNDRTQDDMFVTACLHRQFEFAKLLKINNAFQVVANIVSAGGWKKSIMNFLILEGIISVSYANEQLLGDDTSSSTSRHNKLSCRRLYVLGESLN